ncbi:HDL101Cp [Eremothecium sinecaudum]|uniref:HDL101Cp n=1 Tax=Eremothecium sinecaudum TaxID=45286 RepID=A0A120K272_9SACH|nr:HDL101Cp [Eremothecium sinecaudum]AMD20643.1 HDL101Cp [Eremothecium sinecaudum]
MSNGVGRAERDDLNQGLSVNGQNGIISLDGRILSEEADVSRVARCGFSEIVSQMVNSNCGELPDNTQRASVESTSLPASSTQERYGGHEAAKLASNVVSESTSEDPLFPYFQPFGMDVGKVPVTSPPIFQSSMAAYNSVPTRRRVSLSNGQICQIGQYMDDEDFIGRIYDLQPPPLPQRQRARPATKIQMRSSLHDHARPHPVASPSSHHSEFSEGSQDYQQTETPDSTLANIPQQQHIQPFVHDMVPATPQDGMMRDALRPSNIRYEQNSKVPGTAAWKRARLLERNRIAASKCRQRKKIVQQQMQNEVDNLTKENRVIKRKLEYYEKLVNKFKVFIELHMESCGGSKDNFKVVEELLKIDHNFDDADDYTTFREDKNYPTSNKGP